NASIDPTSGRPAAVVAREYATDDDAERADSQRNGAELDAASSERVTTPRWQTIALVRSTGDTTPDEVRSTTEGSHLPVIVPCQYMSGPLTGVDARQHGACGEPNWTNASAIPWGNYGQGEYVGPARQRHVQEYRLRADDQIQLMYRETRISNGEYELQIGDEIRVESTGDSAVDRQVSVQPDGFITLRMLGQIPAARRTLSELRSDLEERYSKTIKEPGITVTPVKVNTHLDDLRLTVTIQSVGIGQGYRLAVAPDGTIQIPILGVVSVQGLTLDELKNELDERYRFRNFEGIEVTPVLLARAPRFVYVVGEVRNPGQFPMTGPTTVMQSVALAGGWNVGGNLRQVVVFRRTDDWRLMATKIDIRGGLYGEKPCPADELFLRDSDIVLVPKSPILRMDDAINLVLTRGIYSLIPGWGNGFGLGAKML
ncbi:MAG TPA: polysaccharide biosynthesis/export family protein, partial [Pirellulaceae bacterium]|nr:polysaccharide biosynthesis/export family protein [Pirellulaceae bacterium]